MIMVQTKTLIKIASYGAVITVGTGVCLQHLLQQKVRNSEVFRELVNRVYHNKGVVALLGEPIKIGSIDASNKSNYCYSDKVHLEVPIKGSKTNGVLEFSAEKPSVDTAWQFISIELEIKDELGGRLNILRQEPNN